MQTACLDERHSLMQKNLDIIFPPDRAGEEPQHASMPNQARLIGKLSTLS